MTSLLWHRAVIRFSRSAWPSLRKLRRVVAWVARTGPEIRIERRRGRMCSHAALIRATARSLRPLDLIVERGPLKLSDVFIPGYFKHVAVYLGPRLSVQVQRLCADGQPRARAGRDLTVLEATREGVRVTSLREFFRGVDSFVVLRGERVSRETRDWVAERAAAELGKEYDYVFDLSDHRRQFCCKLVAGLFPGIPFADLLNIGAPLIPDDFVLPVVSGQARAPKAVMLVEGGRRTPADERARALAELLAGDYADTLSMH